VTGPGARLSSGFLRVFFSLYVVLGLGLIALTPPFQSPDAFAHFDRAFGLAQGHVSNTTSGGSPGNTFPVGVYQMEVVFSGMAAGPGARVATSEFVYGWRQTWSSPKYFTVYDTGGNAPFLYAPQVLGIALGRLFSGRLLVGYYLAEIMNLLAFVALTRWAMAQFARRLALALGVFLLLPMVNSLAISVNPDGLLLALSTVFAAACYNRYHSPTPVGTSGNRPWNFWSDPSDRVGFLSLLFMTIEKPPLLLLGLLLPVADLTSHFRRYVLRALVVTGSVTFAYEVWVQFFAGPLGKRAPLAGVVPIRQLFMVLTHPLTDLAVLSHTLRVNGVLYAKEFIAGIGWLDTWFPSWFYQGMGVILILVMVGAISLRRDHVGRTLGGVAIVVLAALALMFTFYLVDTPYATGTIAGFQGRYLLPLVPSLLVVLGWPSASTPARLGRGSAIVDDYASSALVVLQVCVFAAYVVTVLHRYWT
jgi:hypothetical protein